ncbi:hypothetical protein L1987_36620 [Smallanthus sonchifolius]|uniref:Uncharacterized protein n=1 Tax=Smallanthus sonchifolius TaxID=185202 RepID=A0ACB9HFB7_9ASTR|nr:hypothetical protein L1987_36620 [Smallanthus sonchifolius]
MDIPPPPTTGIVTGSETEPPNRKGKQPAPPSTDGALRRHPPPLTYGKCNKNYSPAAGVSVLDGCGEFMPSRTPTPTHPSFLFCDACGCHRSFHHEPTDNNHPPPHHVTENHHPETSPSSLATTSTPRSPSPSPVSFSRYPTGPPPHMFVAANPALQPQPANQNVKKRTRTKFSEDQKQKMLEFAERIGWKLSKQDDEMIQGFCNDIGVTKRVLKVWIHNHRNDHRERGGNSSNS